MSKKPALPTKVVAYMRVSTARQESDGYSLAAQRARLEAYATTFELDVVEWISESASASSTNREGLQLALTMLEAKKAEGILIIKLDRLTRSLADLVDLSRRYFDSRSNYLLFSAHESINTKTANGRLLTNMLGTLGEWEREQISERTKEGLVEAKAQGVRLGPPRFEDKLDNAKVLEMMLAWRGRGTTHGDIARRLNEMKVLSASGHTWNEDRVGRLLTRVTKERTVG